MNSQMTLGLAASVLLLSFAGAGSASAQDEIQIFVSGKDRPYELLSEQEARVVTVRGPGELRLISRAQFRPADEPARDYTLRVRVDGGAWQEIVYERVERSRTAMFRDGTLGMPGQLMEYRIQLRRGFHNVEVLPAPGSPKIYFRHLFKPKKARKRSWVSLAPLGDPELVELVIRETFVTYYRNDPGRPFELDVIGPTELRVFTRVENTPEMRGRIHYRLQVREDDRVINTFQLSSRRSQVALYAENDELVPGRASEIVIPVPPGRHRLKILPLDPNKSSLLARFMLPKEDLKLTVSP
ncbi:MAG: hypothetical protein AAGC60_15800 [Acidobacteriota bacterium]